MKFLDEFPPETREDLFLILLFATIGIWLFVIGDAAMGQRILDGLFGAVVMRMKTK